MQLATYLFPIIITDLFTNNCLLPNLVKPYDVIKLPNVRKSSSSTLALPYKTCDKKISLLDVNLSEDHFWWRVWGAS